MDILESLNSIRNKLLDLSKRNRLLNFKRNKGSLVIVDELPNNVYDFLVVSAKEMVFQPIPEPKPEQIILNLSNSNSEEQSAMQEDRLNAQGNLTDIDLSEELPGQEDNSINVSEKHSDKFLQTSLFASELDTRLRRMSSTARTTIEETGQNMLFLAIGFLQWSESSDSEQYYNAPLILVPVELKRKRMDPKSHYYQYAVNYTGEEILPNLSLKHMLNRDFGMDLPNFNVDSGDITESEEEDLIPEEYFEKVNSLISEMTGWKIKRSMVLGFFSFSRLLMYMDLNVDSWPAKNDILEHSIFKLLVDGCDEPIFPIDIEDETPDLNLLSDSLPTVLDADSSQIEVISKALDLNNMVIDGPPGTGKSQTITNIIACCLDSGKSVLFVAEKLAALNIVQRNLKMVGLSDFCLELHSHKARKKKVLSNLDNRITRRFANPSDLQRDSRRLKVLRESLSKYLEIVHSAIGPDYETIYEIIGKVELLRTELSIIPKIELASIESVTQDQIDTSFLILNSVAEMTRNTALPWHTIWYGYKATDLYVGDDEVVSEILVEMKSVTMKLIEDTNALVTAIGIQNQSTNYTINQLKSLLTFGNQSIPNGFDPELASKLLIGEEVKCIKSLNSFCSHILDFRNSLASASVILPPTDTMIPEIVEELQVALTNEDAKALNKLHAQSISGLSRECELVKTRIKQINEKLSEQNTFNYSQDCKFSDVRNIFKLDQKLKNRPVLFPKNMDSHYFNLNAIKILGRAQKLSESLTNKRSSLKEIFSFGDLPNIQELELLRKHLRREKGKFFSFLSKEFRKAKRVAISFLLERKFFKSLKFLIELDNLSSHLKKSNSFAVNDQYKSMFGDLFDGLDTDWHAVRDFVEWTNDVTWLSGSSHQANQLLQNYEKDEIDCALPGELFSTFSELEDAIEIILQSTPRLWVKKYLPDINKAPLMSIDSSISKLNEILEAIESNFTKSFKCSVTSCNCKVEEIAEGVNDLLEARIHQIQVEQNDEVKLLLDDRFQGVLSNLESIQETCAWVEAAIEIDLPEDIKLGLSNSNITSIQVLLNELTHSWNQSFVLIEEECQKLSQFGEFKREIIFGSQLSEVGLQDLQESLSNLQSEVNSLSQWSDYCRLAKRAEDLGLSSIIEMVEKGDVPAHEAAKLFLFTVYYDILKHTLRLKPELSTFSAAEHEEIRRQFKNCDKAIQEKRREHISDKARRVQLPRGVSSGPVRMWTEFALLNREITKKSRHIPIRQLLDRSGKVIRALKPVFMMSPMSVAQFLKPGKHRFDVVIMDEASQIRPQEALGAVLRGSQLLVVGDPKQLPPTSFFNKIFDDIDLDEEETSADDTESILDWSKNAGFLPKRLQWHYRSEHESLIAFSNSQWYENELIIFPSPKGESKDLGIKFHYVNNSKYSSGKNEVEADIVANAILEHARRHPNLSLGVGTFNIKQRNLIEDRLAFLCKEIPEADALLSKLINPESGNEPLFIKNLENLQGDQRDVIFISCTFGPDSETGKVFQRFGPILMANGPRRLNVLISRAKKRMEVFSSMQPEEILIGPGVSEGAIAFGKFLKYAKTGELPDIGLPTGREPDSDFERAVIKVLLQNGHECEPQYGVSGFFIDIAVKHPDLSGRYILGIECDGAAYHSTRFARDRDRLREEILKRRGWEIHRIWSTDWFKNRDGVIKKLLNKLEELRKSDQLNLSVIVQEEKLTELEVKELLKPRHSDDELRERLLTYREANSLSKNNQNGRGILSEELIDAFVTHRPTSRELFLDKVPINLRVDIDVDEIEYLYDILSIIEAAEGGVN